MQSKWLLLQTASPAALIRLKNSSSLQSEVQLLNDIYFIQQHHSSLLEFLFYNLNESTITEGLLMQVIYSVKTNFLFVFKCACMDNLDHYKQSPINQQ